MCTNFPLWPKTGSEKFRVMFAHVATLVALSAGLDDTIVGAVESCGDVVDVVVVVEVVVEVVVVVGATVVVVVVVDVVVVVVEVVVEEEDVVVGTVVDVVVDVVVEIVTTSTGEVVDASSTTGVAVWMTEGIVAGGRVFTTRSGLKAGGVDAKVVGEVIDVDDAVA